MPISFHRLLRPFPSLDEVHPVQDNLHHSYVATVAARGTALPTIQRGLETIEREHAPVGSLPPAPVPEGVDAPSLATRFLSLLHEELRPSSYILPRDSKGYLIDPLQTIAVTFRSGDPNDLELEPAELTYPAPLVSSTVARGSLNWEEEPEIKYLCTITRDGWSTRPEVVVK